jgi:hypothetical protein
MILTFRKSNKTRWSQAGTYWSSGEQKYPTAKAFKAQQLLHML